MSCFGHNNYFRVTPVEGKGNCAFALRSIGAGEVVLREAPLVIVPVDAVAQEDVVELSLSYPTVDAQLFAYYLEYERMSEEQREVLSEFYSPLDTEKAVEMLAQLHSLTGFSSRFDIPSFVKVAMAFHYNGAEVTPPPADGSSNSIEYGVGLYPIACKISHSCDSNAGWYLNEDKWRIVQSVVAIEEGEEITVDYSHGALLLAPTVLRKKHFADHFDCFCSRCNSSSGDKTRRVGCVSDFSRLMDAQRQASSSAVVVTAAGGEGSSNNFAPTCKGTHIIHQNSESESPSFSPCSVCNASAPERFVKYMLEWEIALANQVEYFSEVLDDVIDDEDSANDFSYYNLTNHDFESLSCFSLYHHLAYKVASIKYRYFVSSLGGEDFEKAILMKQEQIQVLHNICGGKPSRTLAFQNEIVADLAKDIDRFDLAIASLEEALRMQLIVSGTESPYTLCVKRALDEVRSEKSSKSE